METKLSSRLESSPEQQPLSTTTNPRLSSLASRDGINIMHTSTPNRLMQHTQTISTPSMKAMIPLPMDEAFQHSSSTESTHDQQDRDQTMLKYPETPKRSKPSKIPLPGSKGVVAKPPSGRPSAGPPSNKSLTKSTSSLYIGQKSGEPLSITKKDMSLTRPDSVQSWRNLSFDGKSRSSSIPISNKPILSVASSPNGTASPLNYGPPTVTIASSPNGLNNSKYVTSSPLPRPKRDSLTTKVKHLDSLSRLQSSSTGMLPMTIGKSPSLAQNVVTNSTNGSNNRKHTTALPIRRMSNVSMGRDMTDSNNGSNVNETNGKVRTIRSSIWNWLKI